MTFSACFDAFSLVAAWIDSKIIIFLADGNAFFFTNISCEIRTHGIEMLSGESPRYDKVLGVR
jgi:hypothetical protein